MVAPSWAPGTAPRTTASDDDSGTCPVATLPTTPAVAASAVIASELPMVIRIGRPTTTMSSGTSRNAPPAPTRPAAVPTAAQTSSALGQLNVDLVGGDRRVDRLGRDDEQRERGQRHDAEDEQQEPIVDVLGGDGAGERAAAMVSPPSTARSRRTARRRRWTMKPDTAATKTCTIVTAATVLTSSAPTPSSGGP